VLFIQVVPEALRPDSQLSALRPDSQLSDLTNFKSSIEDLKFK
jgi:hypothetical protein